MPTLKEYILQFRPMSEASYGELENLLSEVRLSKGDVLITADVVDSNLYVSYEGLLRGYYYDSKGNEVTEYFVTPGNLVAAMCSYFQGDPAFIQVEAITDAVLYSIPHDGIEDLCSRNIEVANWFRVVCLDELFGLEWKCRIFGKEDALSRYRSILQLRPEIIQNVSLKNISSYLKITQQSLSRLRAKIKTK